MTENQRWTTALMPDQGGRVAVVTGANSGVGLAAAEALAAKGATVVMACRSLPRAETAAGQIRSRHPQAKLRILALDLADLASVRALAIAFVNLYDRLDLLVNNAGVMMPPAGQTRDGFELQFGVNHLGHFALTGLLLDPLLATPAARVVTVSSLSALGGLLDRAELTGPQTFAGVVRLPYSRFFTYGRSKMANLSFAVELQRRFEATGVKTLSLASHPGLTASNLQRHSLLARLLNPLLAQGPEMGALPVLYAATAPGIRGGAYYGPGSLFGLRGYPAPAWLPWMATNRERARRLWSISEQMTGVRYEALEP